MIRSSLRKLGATDEEFEQLYGEVEKKHTTGVRGKGAVSAIAGIAMVVVGFVALGMSSNGSGGARILIVLIGGGAVMAIKGLVTLASGLKE